MSYGYDFDPVDLIQPPPLRIVTRVNEVGVVVPDAQTMCDEISARSEWGTVSPLAPDLGRCFLWEPRYKVTKENRGYPMIRPVPGGHLQYVYRVYEKALCEYYGNEARGKWLTNPVCHNKRCVNPEHWAK